jgi:hypothetical protein
MITEIAAALTAARTAGDLVNTIQKLGADVEINAAVISIQQELLKTQQAVFSVNDRIEALNRENAALQSKLNEADSWKAESQRYQLTEVAAGILLYVLKPDAANGEPTHYLCPNCFGTKQKSILQKPKVTSLSYHCHGCNFRVQTEPTPPPHMTVVSRPSRRSLLG